MIFVWTLRDVVFVSLLGLTLLLFAGALMVSWASLLLCKVRGHRFRVERPEPFAPCVRCGRRVG